MNPFAEVTGKDQGVTEWGHEFFLERIGGTVSMYVDGNEIRMTQAETLKLSAALRKVASQEAK